LADPAGVAGLKTTNPAEAGFKTNNPAKAGLFGMHDPAQAGP
jgi:hypothetical protein